MHHEENFPNKQKMCKSTAQSLLHMRTELKSQLFLLFFYGIKRNTDEEREPPLLSNESHLSGMFVVEK